jgi:hypothetical protein
MSNLSAYCKAYPLEHLRAYAHWADAHRGHTADGYGDFAFVHDNYEVTGGIFVDDDVIFRDITPEWVAFCSSELDFKVPEDVLRLNAATFLESTNKSGE